MKIVTDEKEFYLYAKVSDLSPYFDSDERFYPCMKGMVVNFDRVSSMKDQIIYFRNGMQYMLGRTNYLKTKQRDPLPVRSSGRRWSRPIRVTPERTTSICPSGCSSLNEVSDRYQVS